MATVAVAPTHRWRRLPIAWAHKVRVVALAWAPLALAAVVATIVLRGVPARGEAGYWELLATGGALVVYAAGWVVAWKHTIGGATVMALAAATAGVLWAVEHVPSSAGVVAIGLAVPAFLLWLVWQADHTLPAVAAVAAVLVGLLAIGGYAGAQVWDSFYGPQHPSSSLRAGPATPVRWVWSGGVTTSAATVVAAVRGTTARLAVSESSDLADARFVDGAVGDDGVVRFEFDGLAPDRTYHYAVEVDGVADLDKAGRFSTFPDGAASFRFAFGSCSRLGSNGAVYDAAREAEPAFFLVTGDWFYADIASNDAGAFRDAYETTLTAPAQAALYRSTSVAYVWDDHDYGPNDADGSSASRPAALATYQARVPHHPLLSPDGPIAQAFTVGRVRFVVLDTRSARDATSLLGEAQRAWVQAELVGSRDRFGLVVLVTSVPWIAEASPAADHWGGYPDERRWLADLVARPDTADVLLLAGDAHMVAIDDGTNSDYSTIRAGGFPVMHAAALDRPGSVKGGPYSEGAHGGAGQYGLVDVRDDGTTISVSLDGRTWDGRSLVSYEFSMEAPGT
jgi:hypothetical protein